MISIDLVKNAHTEDNEKCEFLWDITEEDLKNRFDVLFLTLEKLD